MFGTSLDAFSVPLRAITQNSEALFVTNASLCFVPAPVPLVFVGAGWHPANTKTSMNVQTKAEINGADLCSRISFLVNCFDWANFLAYSAGLEKLDRV
jgi:hypothetical protein